MSIELYNKVFQKFLQSNVELSVNGKILKAGVIKLFMFKQYFVKFNIDIPDKDIKIVEIPYPYQISYDEVSKSCCLNYKLSALCHNDREMMDSLRRMTPPRTHKFYDNVVMITSIN